MNQLISDFYFTVGFEEKVGLAFYRVTRELRVKDLRTRMVLETHSRITVT